MMTNMMTTQPIARLMDELPTSGVTIYMLKGLDFVVPGQWQNITGFETMIRTVTNETNPRRLEAIARRATELYNDPAQGYQRAMWLYQTVDTADKVLAATAMANKIGEKIGFLSFLGNLTPKSDTVQAIDFGLKLTTEMLAFGLINGLPRDGVMQFAQSLSNYSGENIMRLATLICVDGLVPLGPDFLSKIGGTLTQTQPAELQSNGIYQQVSSLIPGDGAAQQLGFIQQLFASSREWINNFQVSHNLSPQTVLGSLKNVIDIADGKLDYVGAFLDATTNYYAHTGTQSIARHVIARAASEVPVNLPEEPTQVRTLSGSKAESSTGVAGGRRRRDEGESDDKPQRRGRDNAATDAADVDSLKAKVKEYLEGLGHDYNEDDEGSLYVNIGSTTLYFIPYEWDGFDQPLLEVRATVAGDIEEMSKKAANYLLEQNAEIPFGALCYFEDEATINLSYAMLSSMLNQNSLAVAIEKVGGYADDIDEDVVEMTGGYRSADYEGGKELKRSKRTQGTGEKSGRKVWAELESYLDKLGLDYKEDDESYYVEVGSTLVYITAYESAPQIIVEIAGTVSAEYGKLPLKTVVNLLKANATEVPFGGFYVDTDAEYIYFSYSVMADYLDAETLNFLIDRVGEIADEYDDDIAAETGGSLEEDM